MDTAQQFLETEDLDLLRQNPLLFEKHDAGFKKFLCCIGAMGGIASAGLSATLMPIGTFCPTQLYPEFSLQVRHIFDSCFAASFH